VTPKLNNARFVRVQLQPELLHTLFPLGRKSLCVSSIFEPHDDVIGVPDNGQVFGSLMPFLCYSFIHNSKPVLSRRTQHPAGYPTVGRRTAFYRSLGIGEVG
jgi:hypothetical protein